MRNTPGIILGVRMTDEQAHQIRVAASNAIFRLTSMLGYPTLTDLMAVDGAIADLEKIKSIIYELDAKCSHDDCTAVADNSELKVAA